MIDQRCGQPRKTEGLSEGNLYINWLNNEDVIMTGLVDMVFEGQFYA